MKRNSFYRLTIPNNIDCSSLVDSWTLKLFCDWQKKLFCIDPFQIYIQVYHFLLDYQYFFQICFKNLHRYAELWKLCFPFVSIFYEIVRYGRELMAHVWHLQNSFVTIKWQVHVSKVLMKIKRIFFLFNLDVSLLRNIKKMVAFKKNN